MLDIDLLLAILPFIQKNYGILNCSLEIKDFE